MLITVRTLQANRKGNLQQVVLPSRVPCASSECMTISEKCTYTMCFEKSGDWNWYATFTYTKHILHFIRLKSLFFNTASHFFFFRSYGLFHWKGISSTGKCMQKMPINARWWLHCLFLICNRISSALSPIVIVMMTINIILYSSGIIARHYCKPL